MYWLSYLIINSSYNALIQQSLSLTIDITTEEHNEQPDGWHHVAKRSDVSWCCLCDIDSERQVTDFMFSIVV
jgi:hypothetical protein